MASLERDLHAWLQTQLDHSNHAQVLIGVGDDAAVLKGSNESVVVSTDTIADGTHFQTAQHALGRIGRKSLAVNLSDIAAMGATPSAAVLHWMLPTSFSLPDAKLLFLGIQKLADQHGVAIIGGDTNSWNGPLVVGATAFGTLATGHSAWRMNSASPGDALFVSGQFGGSILGHHLDFQPEVDLARTLAVGNSITAATDATDSLTRDLEAMTAASGCGAELDLACIPIAEAAVSLAKTELGEQATEDKIAARSLHHALYDGEDFGLILAVDPTNAAAVQQQNESLTRIGAFCERPGLWARRDSGALERIESAGYDH